MCKPDTHESPQEQCIIRGGHRLQGRVQVYGAKNSALPVVIATLLTHSEDNIHELQNVPHIADIRVLLELLSAMGCKCDLSEGHLRIDSADAHCFVSDSPEIYDDAFSRDKFDVLARKIRGSILLLGPMLARFGVVRLPLPGGCSIGARPVDLFLKSMNALGANLTVDEETGCIIGHCNKLVGTTFRFDKVSVCATEAFLMAAIVAHGETVIHNAAQEPDVIELVRFLKNLGAKITGEGTSTIKIQGVPLMSLQPANRHFTIRGDRIEAGTFLFAAATTGGDVHVDGIIPSDLSAVLQVLEEMGCEISTLDNSIHLRSLANLKPVSLSTEPFPAFPTDLQPLLSVCCTQASGTSKIQELIFPSRTGHVSQIQKLGGCIEFSKTDKDLKSRGLNDKGDATTIQIAGPTQLSGEIVSSTDLRCAASLVVAGLVAEGETRVQDLHYLDRGYANVCEKFRLLGANIGRAFVFASGMHILCNEPLSHRTTLRIGGNARYFLSARNRLELARGLAWARVKDLNIFILGGGSNIVVPDEGFDGLVIEIADSSLSVLEESESHVSLQVGAGHNWDKFVATTVEKGFSGIECLSGIPGTVGASPVQNIGAYGQEVGHSIEAVHVMEIKTGKMKKYTKEECMFAYRTSSFKNIWRNRFVITQVEFRLSKSQPILPIPGETTSERVLQHLQTSGLDITLSTIRKAVLELRRQKSMVLCNSDPNAQSVGSFFMNPIVKESTYDSVRQKLGGLGSDKSCLPAKRLPGSNEGDESYFQISAAWLIEQAGFHRGYAHKKFSGVALSSRHCLALITNKSGTSAKSLLGLAELIRNRVNDLYGISLTPEPVILQSHST